MKTAKISSYNLIFFVGLSVTCHIPDTWAYRNKKKIIITKWKEMERDLGMVLLTLPRMSLYNYGF